MVMTAAVLFGLNGSISRLLFDDGITPLTLIEFRMLIGGVCLMTLLIIGQRKGLKVQRLYWGWIVAFGISLALATYTYFLSISRLPIAVALIIIFTAAAWMALWEAIWHRHKPSKHVLVACLFWFIFQPPWAIPTNTWTPYHLFLIALVGIFGMAIPFSLILGSLRRIDTMRVGIVSMLELPAAGIIAYFWLGQRLDAWQIAGCVLVLFGVAILQYEKSEEIQPIE